VLNKYLLKSFFISNFFLLSVLGNVYALEHDESAINKAINHPERSLSDKQKDNSRKPELILPFTQIQAGNKVLELGAGAGHTTELLARLVGTKGSVYAQGLSPSRIT